MGRGAAGTSAPFQPNAGLDPQFVDRGSRACGLWGQLLSKEAKSLALRRSGRWMKLGTPKEFRLSGN